jgi:hypothetical protein
MIQEPDLFHSWCSFILRTVLAKLLQIHYEITGKRCLSVPRGFLEEKSEKLETVQEREKVIIP